MSPEESDKRQVSKRRIIRRVQINLQLRKALLTKKLSEKYLVAQ